jgi:hypothetical protein
MVLEKKRKEYFDVVTETFANGVEALDQKIYHQIHIDMPRTHPTIPLYGKARVHCILERILYCWAISHTASGYVQGINDLVTPFFQVFLGTYIHTNGDIAAYGFTDSVETTLDIDTVSKDILDKVEADSYWCLSSLLNGIQASIWIDRDGWIIDNP